MSRKSNTTERREQIVDAMLSVMAQHGYEKATIQAIAEYAELSPGLIHYHFRNKEEILLALVSSIAELSYQRYLTLSEMATTPAESLRAYINARLALGGGANPKAVAAWVVIGTEAVRQTEVRNAYQSVIDRELALVQALIKACLLEQGRRQTNAAQFATILLAFMEGAFQLDSAARDVMPKGYAAAAALLMIERLIAGEAVSKRAP